MYLKSIEVQGFKSFANKMKLDFHNGITGIVGPNGSGKSNIADAVRWVLGEQRTKQLRGASMQDVIFAGTELRKPLGYAYVAITLDNSDHALAIDYDEVTVSRRLYRSGESEYMINGAGCRLKDVNELFYDTGIGKEGYSIIGQGQIDRLLSSKPEDRRMLFDEAAGIVKFKLRKEAALKKLEDEKANLLRLTDILSELEKQIGPLEKQSEIAKIYLKNREQLKTLDVNLFLVDSENQRTQLEEAGEKYKIAAQDLENAEQALTDAKTLYDETTEALRTLEEEIVKETERMTQSSVLREKLEGQIAVLNEQIRSATSNEAHFTQRRDTLQAEVAAVEQDLKERTDARALIDEELSSYEKNHGEAVSKHDEISRQIEELNGKIEESNALILEALDKRAQIKSRIGALDTKTEAAQIRKAELTGKLINVKSEGKLQEESLEKLRQVFADVSKEIDELNAAQKNAEEELSGIKGKLTSLDETLRKAQLDYQTGKTRLEALTNIAERYEGYGGSVKAVMEQREQVSGIEGVVADIIRTEAKYETAIETALGASIQNIVTDNAETAKRLIEYLKKNKAGRATFLPLSELDSVKEFDRKEALLGKGVIGLACDLVKTEPKYNNVALSLLGRIIVADHIDNAIALQREYQNKLRIVTVQGELLAPGGSISGGAFKNSSNLLGRRREIEALTKQVAELDQAAKDAQSSIDNTKQYRNELRVQIETGRTALQNKFIEQNTARINVEVEEEKQKEAAESEASIRRESEEVAEQLTEIEAERAEQDALLKETEETETNAHNEITAAQERLKGLVDEEQAALKIVSDQKTEAEKIRQKILFEQENIDRITDELKAKQADLTEVETSLKENTEKLAQCKEDIEKVNTTIQASTDATDDAKNELATKQQAKEDMNAKQQEAFKQVNTLSEQMTGLDREVNRLEAMKARLLESIQNRTTYMWDEYEITLSDAENMRDPELTDVSGMKKDIAALKDAIKKLGDVNVAAIEDYRVLKERYEFMTGQHEDIVAAEAQLRGIIEELDKSMREQFTEQFAHIRTAFNGVFREMFGGGKGELELIEGEDVLTAGIKIIAQPPGKKLQNMMQLSGGEKALTAIALLFAIQSLKPSPFCLLDEIEAALDESNVVRFAQYLHKLKDTQFIVITHRRGTMEAADRLYGITMQEKGVSALVSVNLIDKELSD